MAPRCGAALCVAFSSEPTRRAPAQLRPPAPQLRPTAPTHTRQPSTHLNVVTQDLAVALGSSFSESLASLSASGHL